MTIGQTPAAPCYTAHMQATAIVSGDFVRTGGMDVANYALAQRMAERGMSTHVVAHRVADDLANTTGVVWHRVPKPLNSYLCGSPFLDLAGQRVARLIGRSAGRTVVNGGNCQVHDVNWVHYVHAAFEPQPQGSPLRRAKAVLERSLNLVRERTAVRGARLVIANSERTRHDLERLGVDGSRIRTVYYGIDPSRFAPADEQQRAESGTALGLAGRLKVVFVGGLGDRRKGFDTLYAAWRQLCARSTWDCDLIVIGQGADLNRWRARAKSDGIEDRIRFLGFRSDVPAILAACDALVAPTRYEAYGLGVHEALCCGLPAIVSADAGVAERFPAELTELLLQDPNSAEELLQRLDHWRGNAERLRASTIQLAATLRRRTWATMADEIISLIA